MLGTRGISRGRTLGVIAGVFAALAAGVLAAACSSTPPPQPTSAATPADSAAAAAVDVTADAVGMILCANPDIYGGPLVKIEGDSAADCPEAAPAPPVVTVAPLQPGAERWTADVQSVNRDVDRSHAVSVLLFAHSSDATDMVPVTLRVSLYGEWADCGLDPDSWTATISPSEHPRVEHRSWEFHTATAEIAAADDGTAEWSGAYELVSGDDRALLELTAKTLPGCPAAPIEAPESASPVEESESDEQPTTAGETTDAEPETSESVTEEDAETAEPDSDEGTEADETATTEPEQEPETEPRVRVVDVELRRWDHQALIDLPLWAHCPPEPEPDWLRARMDKYRSVWNGWADEVVEMDGYYVASGWWTDEQIGRWLPGAGVTAAMAYEHAVYHPIADTVALWPDTLMPTTMPIEAPPDQLPTLTAALRHRGHGIDGFADLLRATSRGVAGAGAWPESIDVGKLLTSWVRFRMSQPPTTHEPVAWPLRSLFDARESGCAAEALREMCESEQTPPAVLAAAHPIGRVLRSLACGE